MLIEIPTTFTKKHEQALTDYLTGRQGLNTITWRLLYEGIDLLDKAQIITDGSRQTFRQLYTKYVERPFADQFIEELLTSQNVVKESPSIGASYARKIGPKLQEAGLVARDNSQSWLLQAYCIYWWQSFTRGYAFEVEIMRDLTNSDINFQMHDVSNRIERFSPADLIVLNLLGDIKTSIYFLQ